MNSHIVVSSKIKPPGIVILISLFLLSGALLVFEITLTRLFSIAQFYHFAFMVVSIALLGFGASGTTIAIFPSFLRKDEYLITSALGFAAVLSIITSYLLSNWLPFDSFSIAWDRTQILILIIHYISLASPFYFGGLLVGFLLTKFPETANRTYAFNLTGSAFGCLFAVLLPGLIDGVGTVLSSCIMGILAALIPFVKLFKQQRLPGLFIRNLLILLASVVLLFLSIIDIRSRYLEKKPFGFLELKISPYKSLSYALQYPGARIVSSQWNYYSKIDLVRSGGIRSLPGLSYRYTGILPEQDGLLKDGDDINSVIRNLDENNIYKYLPTSIVYNLRPSGDVLILEPGGGLEIVTALHHNPANITVVEENPLVVQAASHIYNNPALVHELGSSRNFLKRSQEYFDIIVLSLVANYHPVRSGAYSLSENYLYTVESIQEAVKRLEPDGILIFTRWLQNPPSEFLRAFAISIHALEGLGIDPLNNIIAFRGFNTGTLLVKRIGFTEDEQSRIEQFLEDRSFDLVYAPDIHPSLVNKYNVLTEPIYYLTFQDIIQSNNRSDFYRLYSFNISPPTDNKPFFGQYFKWGQTSQVIAEFGKTWQPFGGAGFFVLLVLLFIAGFIALLLIIIPVLIAQIRMSNSSLKTQIYSSPLTFQKRRTIYYLLYFGSLGFAFLMVEIPLIQKFILILGHPATSLTTILFTILFFSGLGSMMSPKLNITQIFFALLVTLVLLPFLLPVISNLILGLPLIFRIVLTIVVIAPVGFLMGVPFPKGIKLMTIQEANPILIPWIWAVNGSTSVISSILAALIALSLGFNWVFIAGGLFYLGSFLAAQRIFNLRPAQPLLQ